VTDQVLRLLRLGPLAEIPRSPDNRHAHVRPDAHGDHILRQLLTGPHAGVETLGDDIDQAVVDDDLDLDVRILPQELHELRPENRVGREVGGRDSNSAGRLLAKLA